MKKLYIGFVLSLIVIITAILATNKNDTITSKDIDACKASVALASKIAGATWRDFNCKNTMIAIEKGYNEYIIKNGRFLYKRKLTFPTPVATASKYRGQLYVFIPAEETMSDISELAEGVSGDEGELQQSIFKKLTNTGYKMSHEYYQGTILHEAFHLYQIQHGLLNNLYSDKLLTDYGEKQFGEMLAKLNRDSYGKSIYNKIYRLIYETFNKNNISSGNISDILTLDQKRRDYIIKKYGYNGKCFIEFEDKKEAYEGSAEYVLFKSLEISGDKKDLQHIIKDLYDGINIYNANRYYNLGTMKCLILDKIKKEWHNKLLYQWNLNSILREEGNNRDQPKCKY